MYLTLSTIMALTAGSELKKFHNDEESSTSGSSRLTLKSIGAESVNPVYLGTEYPAPHPGWKNLCCAVRSGLYMRQPRRNISEQTAFAEKLISLL
jgi:hypothetical protein